MSKDKQSLAHSVLNARKIERRKGISKTMLFKRWKKVFHSRYAGIGYNSLMGAIIKSCGTERMEKRQQKNCQMCAIELNESEELMKHR